MLRWFARPVLAGVSVALAPGPALLPEECACCGNSATHQLATELGARSLLIGYCDECAEHQASASSRVLAVALASLLLGLTSALGLPLLAQRVGALGLALLALVSAFVPFIFLWLPRGQFAPPHTARGAAVIWLPDGRLWCARSSYAERVAALNRAPLELASRREVVASPWLAAGPLAALGAAVISFFVYHPLLRVLNLGSSRIEVALDGVHLVAVDATSNESPAAGALVRVPAGRHSLTVSSTTDGALLDRVEVDFESGAVHLFAPGAAGTCFWLETTGYGEEQLTKSAYQPLRSENGFWVLPSGIDNWFAPNPVPSDTRSHSSGGLLTALRQAPCADAPPEARAPD